MIRAYISSTDVSNSSVHNFNNMLRNGEDLHFWSGKLSRKTHYKNGVAHGPHFAFDDWFDFGYGYLRVHGQYKDGKKYGDWIYSSSEEKWVYPTVNGVFNNLEHQGEIQWVEKYEDGKLQYTNKSF